MGLCCGLFIKPQSDVTHVAENIKTNLLLYLNLVRYSIVSEVAILTPCADELFLSLFI